MPYLELLRLVWSNLRRMKFRVAMTAAGVTIGTSAIILLVSLGAGLQQAAVEGLVSIGELTELTVYSPRSFAFMETGLPQANQSVLNEKTIDELRAYAGVRAVTPLVRLAGGATAQLNRLVGFPSIVGIEPGQVEHLDFSLASGVARLGSWQGIAGARVAENFFDARSGNMVDQPPDLQGKTIQVSLNRVAEDGKVVERLIRVRVVGVLEESGGEKDNTLYLSLRDVQELNQWETGVRANIDRDGYDQALVKVVDTRAATDVEGKLSREGFLVLSPQSILRQVNTLFLVIQIVLGGVGGVALVVAAFGIANAMIMAIYERTREIGLMKAVGARNRDVMFIFLGEAGSIGLLGGLGGVIAGMLAGVVIRFVASTYIAAQIAQSGGAAGDIVAPIHTPVWLPLFALLFAILIGVISGIYPAMRATRLNPIDALRYE